MIGKMWFLWLDIARMLETQQSSDCAATEYEQLAEVRANEKQAILALLGAGRLYLNSLNRAEDALRHCRAAASSLPHLDWESNIQVGIREAEQTLGKTAVTATPARP